MAQDWAADVKKFVANADDEVINAIVKYCGIALHNQDSSLVSYSDPVELDRVRENFLKKKLGLTHSDADLDSGIAAVGERMKGTNFKNRVTVYYLLLEQFGMLDFFRKAGGAVAGAAAAAGAGVAAATLTGSDKDEEVKPVAATTTNDASVAPAVVAGATAATGAAASSAATPLRATSDDYAATTTTTTDYTDTYVEEEKSGMGWLWWLLGALALLGLLWWLFFRQPAAKVEAPTPAATETVKTDAPATVPADDITKAPAEGTVTIPTGAGVTTETRDGKPVVKVYFDTSKTDVAPAFVPAAASLKAYLDSHAGSSLAVSGFNDPRGNAEANAKLSKGRAEAVKADLVKAGIADGSIELVKPAAATDKTVDNASARRVEVVVR